MRRLGCLAAVVAVAVLLVGCESTDESYKATGTDTNCPDQSRVADAAGHPISTRTELGAVRNLNDLSYSVTGCSYTLRDSGGTISVGRVAPDGSSGATYQAIQHAAEDKAGTARFEQVTGLADGAWLDGKRLVLRTGSTMLFVDASDIPGDTSSVETRLARALLGSGSVRSTLDCAAVSEPVGRVLASPSAPSDAVSYERSGEAEFKASGCTYFFEQNRSIKVMTADGAYWKGWVDTKSASTMRDRYATTSILGRPAFRYGSTLVVSDPKSLIEIQTSQVQGSAAELDALRRAVAELMVNLVSVHGRSSDGPTPSHS
jgi:hypothetical protein